MSEMRTCEEPKRLKGWPDPHNFCGKPAKFICDVTSGFWMKGRKQYRCAIHAKKHKILEPYTQEQTTGNS